MPRGGKRQGAGRKAKVEELGLDAGPLPPLPQTTAGYDRLIQALNADPVEDESAKDPETAGWRRSWDSPNPAVSLNTRRFLYTMRDGNPRHTVNHLHDKPIDVNVNVQLSEIIREVRERKREYERSRR